MNNNPYAGISNQVYGLEEGASSPRESALIYQQKMEKEQNELNKKIGGSTKYYKKYSKLRKMYGGQIVTGQVPAGQVEVPSFNPPGPQVSPFDANSASKQGNQAFVNSLASGCNDCHVDNSCGSRPECPPPISKGGSKSNKQNKPFQIELNRVKKSPFKNIKSVKHSLKKWKKNKKSIGFTMRSSLKSMGLIPRSSGVYELGKKYSKDKNTSNKSKNIRNQKKNKKTRKNRY